MGQSKPIDLYTWPTPNGWKVQIMLEELNADFTVNPINIGKGDQFQPEFLKISPNNKMPAIVDHDGPDGAPISVFESGAILIYLAEKFGKFLSDDPRKRMVTLQWLMFQMGGAGPMLGQTHHFRKHAPEPVPYAIERYTNEAGRLYDVVDRRLGEGEFMAGDDYSIADIALFPWLRLHEGQGVDIETRQNVKRWLDTIEARPAVQRGLAILIEHRKVVKPGTAEHEAMFGKKQFEKR